MLITKEMIGKELFGNFKPKGWITARVKRKGSDVWEEVFKDKPVPNLIVTAGKAWVAYLLMSDTPTKLTHGAIGTGVGAAAAGDTALGTQILTRDEAVLSRVTTSVSNDTAQFVSEFTSDGSYAVTEYGTFSASSGGTMLNRVVFSAINLTNEDVLEVTYKCQVS